MILKLNYGGTEKMQGVRGVSCVKKALDKGA
jgi:hypothetical protein